MRLDVPFYRQEQEWTCGPACLRMVLEYHGLSVPESELVARCATNFAGTGLGAFMQAAVDLGFQADLMDHMTRADVAASLRERRPLVAIVDPGLLYRGVPSFAHAVVIVGTGQEGVTLHDPEASGSVTIPWKRFRMAWNARKGRGIILWKP